MKTRTFIAIQPSKEIRARALAVIDRLRDDADDFRWVAGENLHYTLQFLGDLADAEVAEVCQRVLRTAAALEAFPLNAYGAGAFPTNERPRTLWVGAAQGAEDVVRLHAQLDAALLDMGFRGEIRKFVPHLTIGRLGRQSRSRSAELPQRLAELADYDAGAMTVDRVTVMASELRRDGPAYHVLATAPLG